MEELAPATQQSNQHGQEDYSQQSIDRVPESPPIYTQTDDLCDEEEEDTSADGKAQQQLLDKESAPAGGGLLRGTTTKQKPDVVIEMGDDFDKDFPDEDDALLVSAASNLEKGEVDGEDDLLQDVGSVYASETLELDDDLKTQEEAMRKEMEGVRRFRPLEKIFPDVRCSEYNTVAFSMRPNYTPGEPLDPHPSHFVAKWEPKYVPMPCCAENIVSIRCRNNQGTTGDSGTDNRNQNNQEQRCEENPESYTVKKIPMWQRITETLSGIILCSQDIAGAIRRYCRLHSKLNALSYCIEELMKADERTKFFSEVIPFMQKLVLCLPEIVTCPIPVLRKNVNHNISLSQKQVACLLANAFFCTFPQRFGTETDLPSINFKELFAEDDNDERRLIMKANKIRCLINYFFRVSTEMPQGVVTYTRKNLRHSNMPEWDKIDKGLTKFIPLINGTIEDEGAGMLQVDFANRVIGGGVLGRGTVQEEILFVIYPELIITRLFTEKLNSNEAVIVTGCERFSKYHGYSVSFKFDGDYYDSTSYDSKGRRCTQIVAIDALYISRPSFQFHPRHITRELNKAFVGFSSPLGSPVAVATGKWGCGAFNGDPPLKAVIQLLAASHAGRDIVFFTFGDVECYKDVIAIYGCIRDMKIKDAWNLLYQYHSLCCSASKITRTLKEFCMQYAAGKLWQMQQEQAKSSSSSKPPVMKEVPITKFYAPVKRTDPSATLDDANVTAIINGIDKINSNSKHRSPTNGGKRQREDSDTNNLTEEEIQKMLQHEISVSVTENAKEVQNTFDLKSDNAGIEATPQSSKRPKRLEDFYEEPFDESG